MENEAAQSLATSGVERVCYYCYTFLKVYLYIDISNIDIT